MSDAEQRGPPTEIAVLVDVVRRLDRLRISYMLTGSLAMSYYAQPRMTRDIDVVVAITGHDAERLSRDFAGSYYVPDELASLIEREGFFNFIHLESVTKIDFIVRRNAAYGLHEFERRQFVDVGGERVAVVSREDLILSKLVWTNASRSETQLRDIRNLTTGDFDREYVARWVGELKLTDVWKAATGA